MHAIFPSQISNLYFKDKHSSIIIPFLILLKFYKIATMKTHCNELFLQSCKFCYDNFQLLVASCYLVKFPENSPPLTIAEQ